MPFDTDEKMAAVLAGVAVDGGVSHQLGEAQDGVVRSLAAIQYPGQDWLA